MPILTDAERCGTELAGKYRIESILGRGGMGVVFRARHAHTRRAVAIKILRPELSQDPGLGKRFIREARAASALTHPNVVEVLDVGIEPDGTIYQVLELLEGTTLRGYLDERVRLTPERTLAVLLPVMDALVRAHALGIVHRDLKPDNIFLARGEGDRITPTLLDFGIAKVSDNRGSVATHTGGVLGTPAYMAPEQARGAKDQSAAIDVWAMGVIAYECMVGSVPFPGDSPAMVMVRIVTEVAPRLDAVEPDLPTPIADAVARALVQDPAGRHPSMQAFIDALHEAAAAAGIAAPGVRESSLGPLSMRPPAAPESAEEIEVNVSMSDREAIGEVAAQLRAQRRHDPDAPTSVGAAHAPTEAAAATPASASVSVTPSGAGRPIWLGLAAVVAIAAIVLAWIAMRPAPTTTAPPSTIIAAPLPPPSAPPPSALPPDVLAPSTTIPAALDPPEVPPASIAHAEPTGHGRRPRTRATEPSTTVVAPPPPTSTAPPEHHGLPGVTGQW